jgi:translation initiation factor 1
VSKSKKISLNPVQSGLNAAFAGLEMAGLPSGPTEVPAEGKAAGPERKPKRGRVVLRRETAHRGGKVVTVVDDFATHLRVAEIEEIAHLLKTRCGCGGTVKDRTIEIQGERVSEIRELLESEGFQVAGVR